MLQPVLDLIHSRSYVGKEVFVQNITYDEVEICTELWISGNRSFMRR